MKRIRIILLVAFILGLVLFQVKFVSENDNLNMKADISLSQKANAEITSGGNFKEHRVATSVCAYNNIETLEYYGWDSGRNFVVKIATRTWINGVSQGPPFDEYYLYSVYTVSSTPQTGIEVTCQGGYNACFPSRICL